MKTLELRKASKPLSEYASKLNEESIVITSNNRPVAALVSVKHADRESLSLGLNPALMEIIRRARAEIRRGKVFSLEQVKRELLAETAAPNEALQPPSRARRGRRSSKGPRAARG